jgi:Flp pilus assembly protein TadB
MNHCVRAKKKKQKKKKKKKKKKRGLKQANNEPGQGRTSLLFSLFFLFFSFFILLYLIMAYIFFKIMSHYVGSSNLDLVKSSL